MATVITCEDFQTNYSSKGKVDEICRSIIGGNTKIVEIIESLAVILTSENSDIRKSGVNFLSSVLGRLPSNFLTEAELLYFSNFFIDRLKDHHSVIPSTLRAIHALIVSTNINVCVSSLVHNLFQFVTCQSHIPEDRHTFFEILKACTDKHLSTLQCMAPDVLYGALSAIEGETDPKNLILIFSFLPRLLKELGVEHSTTDVFDILSTYFPVDFTSVEKDNIIITRTDLAEGLHQSLTATTSLSLQCLPLIIEKLGSSLRAAKVDSYKLLQCVCKSITTEGIQSYLNELWKVIEKDILPPIHASVHQEALLALCDVVGVVSKYDGDISVLNTFLDDIFISVRSFIHTPSDSLFSPAMKILEALCPKSKIGARRAFLEIEVLCKSLKSEGDELYTLLTAILPFLQFHIESESSLRIISTICLNSTCNKNVNVRAVAFTALQKLVRYLAENPTAAVEIYKSLVTSLGRPERDKSTDESSKLLRICAETYHEEVMAHVMSELENSVNSGIISSESLLDAASVIVDIPAVTSKLMALFLRFYEKEENSLSVVKSLLNACKSTLNPAFIRSLQEQYQLIPLLVSHSITTGDVDLLLQTSHLLQIIVSALTEQKQNQIVNDIFDQTTNPELLIILNDSDKNLSGRSLILLEAILGSVRRNVALDNFFEQIVPVILSLSCLHPEILVRHSGGRLLAAFINKGDEKVARNLLEKCATSSSYSENYVTLYSWILKGALLRGLPGLEVWIDNWFSFFQDPSLSRHAASSVKILIEEETIFLNSSSHCIVKYLYRQRLFSYIPRLVANLNSVPESLKDNYLLAFTLLAQSVPKEVLLSESIPLGVAIGHAIKSSDIEVLLPTLSLLKSILEEKLDIFVENITTFMPALLKLSTYSSSLKIRRSALECLFLSAFYPTHIILPFRTMILRELLPCLDDKKRLVRTEAARCRSRWYLVGAVGEDMAFQ